MFGQHYTVHTWQISLSFHIGLGIEDIPVIVADVSDEESLETMCSQTRVVIDVVGPYVKYGEQVIRACISQKCDYVDITGETFVSYWEGK